MFGRMHYGRMRGLPDSQSHECSQGLAVSSRGSFSRWDQGGDPLEPKAVTVACPELASLPLDQTVHLQYMKGDIEGSP